MLPEAIPPLPLLLINIHLAVVVVVAVAPLPVECLASLFHSCFGWVR